MPRRIDQDARRAEIVEALVRVAARDGLHAVSVRSVAGEAGLSSRLVQYSFSTKAELMHAALVHLERQSRSRWAARLRGLPDPPAARAVVEAFLAEALPDDEDSRVFHLLFTSFAVLSMTDATLRAQPFVAGPDRLERELTEVLDRGRADGELAATKDPVLEAARLVLLGHGVGTSVLMGQRSVADARRLVAHHVDVLFGR